MIFTTSNLFLIFSYQYEPFFVLKPLNLICFPGDRPTFPTIVFLSIFSSSSNFYFCPFTLFFFKFISLFTISFVTDKNKNIIKIKTMLNRKEPKKYITRSELKGLITIPKVKKSWGRLGIYWQMKTIPREKNIWMKMKMVCHFFLIELSRTR